MKKLYREIIIVLSITAVFALCSLAFAENDVEMLPQNAVAFTAATPDASGNLVDTATYIYAETYKNRTDIKTVSLPNATYIGDGAFTGCFELVSIDAPNVTQTGSRVFVYCTKIKSANMPRLNQAGSSLFYGCTTLSTVNLPAVTTIEDSAFSGCTSLSSMDLPVTTTIETDAFSGCTSLTTIDLPAATRIGYNAFYGCASLTSVDLPVTTTIDPQAFSCCTSLTTIDLPAATNIGNNAFYSCASLTTLDLPEATAIYDSAFAYCTSLTSLRLDSLLRFNTSVIPTNVKKLVIPSAADNSGPNGFQYAKGLQILVVGSNFIQTMKDGTIPNTADLTVYVPSNMSKEAGEKISAGNSLYTHLVEYDTPVLKDELFISTDGSSKSCVISGDGIDFDYVSTYGVITVDAAGSCMSTNEAYGSIIVKKTITVGEFADIPFSTTCYVRSFNSRAIAETLADGATATMTAYSMRVYTNAALNASTTIYKSDVPTFTFASHNENWYQIVYDGGTGYIPKPYIQIGTVPPPAPSDDSGGGGTDWDINDPDIQPGGNTSGTVTDEGITMTIKINGKDTEVLLALSNFTYDYSEPETVTTITSYQLRKGPDASFGTYQRVKKGTPLTIIGRDGRWLKVDMGHGKIAYILEDMTR